MIFAFLFCLPSEKGSTLKGKNLLPVGANFPFRVDPFLEGTCYVSKQSGSHKGCLEKNGRKSTKFIKSR